jgi:hypothetical protein
VRKRLGFVSNSSSSSFCIYGFPLEEDTISEEEKKNFMKKYLGKDYSEEDDVNESFELYEYIEEKLKGTSLSLEGSQECLDGYWVGRSWSSIDDTETGKQFKDSIKKEAKEIFGKEAKGFGTFEEAWRDG